MPKSGRQKLIDKLGYDPADGYIELRNLLTEQIELAKAEYLAVTAGPVGDRGRAVHNAYDKLSQLLAARKELDLELLPYVHPKMQAVSVDANVQGEMKVELVHFSDIADDDSDPA